MRIGKNQKLLFIGDSITDCDRAKPEGEGLFEALGKGYVAYVDGLLQSVYPELGIRIVNKGISGNTVRDLKKRWQEDVIAQKPDWLSIMIGINDVWRQYDTPFMKEKHVCLDEYEETLRTLVIETKSLAKGIILMTPFYIEANEHDPMRRTMDQYGLVVRKIAEETGSLFVDTQSAFNKVLKFFYPAALAWDRVHPSAVGHMIIARAFLKVIGFDWEKENE
ncbi:lysophospholipase L1-like esterase [Anoxybacillus tepidamans]|uniref:Lysophospholipase L1-like esterase n=1 Tax=Anoxybacteroides tepidamans TaxID=265948 RepID=A0A7W8MW75_9BACL|nr:SGNH/GDSL hydrolase family protein [Anoxybacillus tepidamans]MBB5326352.1 lysophospholipase L1-like esterase [Anoxybacillus tepidamans]